jgi:hypothetical protein
LIHSLKIVYSRLQVQESKLEKAVAALKNTFNITTEGDTHPTDAEEQEDIFGRMKQHLRDVNPTEVIFKPEASAEPLFCTLLPDELHLCSLPRENRALCAYGILKLVFFCERFDFPSPPLPRAHSMLTDPNLVRIRSFLSRKPKTRSQCSCQRRHLHFSQTML